MKVRFRSIVAMFLLMQMLILPASAMMGQDWNDRTLTIDRLVIELDENNATVSVDYELHGVIMIYVFLLGGKVIEPILNELITDAEDVEILEMTKSGAKFNATLNESISVITFSQTIPQVIIKYPDDRRIEFRDTSAVTGLV